MSLLVSAAERNIAHSKYADAHKAFPVI